MIQQHVNLVIHGLALLMLVRRQLKLVALTLLFGGGVPQTSRRQEGREIAGRRRGAEKGTTGKRWAAYFADVLRHG